jgi:N-methylhydantoinase A
VQIVSLRLSAIGTIPALAVRQEPAGVGSDPSKARRPAWFRGRGELVTTILDRSRMPAGHRIAGPAVIESLESTILVPPAWQATMNGDGYVILTGSAAAAGAKS